MTTLPDGMNSAALLEIVAQSLCAFAQTDVTVQDMCFVVDDGRLAGLRSVDELVAAYREKGWTSLAGVLERRRRELTAREFLILHLDGDGFALHCVTVDPEHPRTPPCLAS